MFLRIAMWKNDSGRPGGRGLGSGCPGGPLISERPGGRGLCSGRLDGPLISGRPDGRGLCSGRPDQSSTERVHVSHIDGCLEGEGSHRVDMVIEYDDPYHDPQTEHQSLLTLEPSRVLSAERRSCDSHVTDSKVM